jgi:hypothetical protein
LLRGNSVEQLEAQLVASPEYLQARAGGTTNHFLAALFTDAFNRPLDPAGQDLYGDHDCDHSAARGRVAEQIFTSAEFRKDWVQKSYQRFLNRSADSSGLSAATAALDNGERDETILAVLVSSPEYVATVVPPGFKLVQSFPVGASRNSGERSS